MLRAWRAQQGAYLVIASLMMVALVGIGALSLDVGRLFVLRSQMQNGVDAAALAAATELSRNAGAQARAESAARNALNYQTAFSEVTDLLGTNISLQFFCAIGSEADPEDPTVTANFCSGSEIIENGITRWPATSDIDSHYVRVIMDQSQSDDAYSLPLFFLPVLRLFGLNPDTQSFLQASAMAGRNYYYCDYPPVLLCNPFEDNSPPSNFQDVMNPGDQILLASQGGGASWAPGNFAFLALAGQTGADATAPYLADEGALDCTSPIMTTEPGQMTRRTENAVDTRFDVYSAPGFANSWDDYPPASNVIDYPRDNLAKPGETRFFTGDWDRGDYWNTFHGWKDDVDTYPQFGGGYAHPTELGNPPNFNNYDPAFTRYDMYLWEIENDHLPMREDHFNGTCALEPHECDGEPNPAHNLTGQDPDRRVFSIAVVNCLAQDLGGRLTFQMFGQEGFARVFLTEDSVGPPSRQIWAEYIGWQSPGGNDSNVRVDVQLYE